MDDPKHGEDCMCDDCIKFQGLVEMGEAEYESDALNAKIIALQAENKRLKAKIERLSEPDPRDLPDWESGYCT